MPTIPSANPDFEYVAPLGTATGYLHPLERKKGGIPLAFQITSPFEKQRVLLPHALVMHVNPANLSETHTKKIERFQTRGGWVEQHWGDDLVEISADGSTGAFVNLYTGLSSVLRQRTIAWDRYRDLHDVYHNNGAVYDPFGKIVLQGHVMLMYDRGTYLGSFHSFEVQETDSSPFAFALNWTFKVEHTILQMSSNQPLRVRQPVAQSNNITAARNG
jgi:hypothetical protein